jgi:hypothetical protein
MKISLLQKNFFVKTKNTVVRDLKVPFFLSSSWVHFFCLLRPFTLLYRKHIFSYIGTGTYLLYLRHWEYLMQTRDCLYDTFKRSIPVRLIQGAGQYTPRCLRVHFGLKTTSPKTPKKIESPVSWYLDMYGTVLLTNHFCLYHPSPVLNLFIVLYFILLLQLSPTFLCSFFSFTCLALIFPIFIFFIQDNFG